VLALDAHRLGASMIDSRASVRLVLALMAALLAALAPSSRADAEPSVTALQVSTQPALPTAATVAGGLVRTAPGGSSVQLRVVASYADGSTRDVTADAQTSYTSLAPAAASASASGQVTFAAVSGPEAAGVLVQHGAASTLAAFDVSP
jgi:hypothetical protein